MYLVSSHLASGKNFITIFKTLLAQPAPVFLPGEFHGQYSPWGHKWSDTTERLHFHALEKQMATHSSVLAWSICQV